MSVLVQRFRKVAFAEGLSFVLLLFVAMPMKYLLAIPLAVKIVGWVHGMLFIAYLLIGAQTASEEAWSRRFCVVVFLAAITPFGTFWLDSKLRSS